MGCRQPQWCFKAMGRASNQTIQPWWPMKGPSSSDISVQMTVFHKFEIWLGMIPLIHHGHPVRSRTEVTNEYPQHIQRTSWGGPVGFNCGIALVDGVYINEPKKNGRTTFQPLWMLTVFYKYMDKMDKLYDKLPKFCSLILATLWSFHMAMEIPHGFSC